MNSPLVSRSSTAAIFGQAVHFFERGQLDTAGALCQRIVALDPGHSDALHVLGIVALQKGRTAEALPLIQRSLEINPQQPHVYCTLGNALRDSQQYDAALGSYRRAIELAPGFAGARYGEGNVLMDLGRPEEALASYDAALACQPDNADAYQNRGNALLQLGRLPEALASYERAVALRPESFDALFNCAQVLGRLGRHAQALSIYDRLAELQPDNIEVLIERGSMQYELGRHEEAVRCLEKGAGQRPSAAVYCRLAQCQLALQRAEAALINFEQALKLDRTLLPAADGCTNSLRMLGRFDEALLASGYAVKLAPESPDILYRHAAALRNVGRHEEAAEVFRAVIAIAPDYTYAQGNLLHESLLTCDWRAYDNLVASVVQSVAGGKPACTPGVLLSVSDSAADQLQCARSYMTAQHPLTLSAIPASRAPASRSGARLRLAYVSGDFREHPVSNLLAGVFEHHDRDRWEPIAVSLAPPEPSSMGQRIERAFGQFLDASRMSDAEVVALLRELQVDVAVDLSGLSGAGRPGIFAARPAPVQINYLGYPGTLGSGYHDYIIADQVVIPEDARRFYAEQVLYLPHCFQPNDRSRPLPQHRPGRADCGLPENGFVFCCFNTSYKINPPVFDVWMRLLQTVPDSVLWLSDAGTTASRNLQREAAIRGVDPQRLVFAPRLPESAAHLARLQLADLFLDTFPYTAHATASDVFWAGVPLLTCRGESYAARVSASLLATIGCPELITSDLAQYETQALRLAGSDSVLRELRARIADSRSTSSLFDTEGYCRDLESAYLRAWQQAAGG